MAELNLNFYEETERREPTKNEIVQIEYLVFGVEGIIKTLGSYVNEPSNRRKLAVFVCVYAMF